MLVGGLIGITLMASIVILGCVFSLPRKRKAGAVEEMSTMQAVTQPMAQSNAQGQPPIVEQKKPAKVRKEKPVKIKPIKAPKEKKPGRGFFSFLSHKKDSVEAPAAPAVTPVIQQPAEVAQSGSANLPQAEKMAVPAAVKEEKKLGHGLFSFLSHKKDKAEAPKAQKPAKVVQPKPAKAAKPVKEKQPEAPKVKEVKESRQKVEKDRQAPAPKTEKDHKFGLFGKRKEADAPQPSKTASLGKAPQAATPAYAPPPSSVDVNKPFVMPAAAMATSTAQAASAPGAVPQPLSAPTPSAPATQPPQGIDPATPQAAAPNDSAGTAEPDKKEGESAADSLFNLFTDTEGEESEITKFAANFDNVSVDSLLGDCQDVLKSISKN
jgi:hypothetical protein